MMTAHNEKLHLSDTIDYDRDIAPYQFIKIFAGVSFISSSEHCVPLMKQLSE